MAAKKPNQLLCGDNTQLLPTLYRDFLATIRLVYLDPPFNTGRRFAEYNDRQTPEKWADHLRRTMELVLPLLRDDANIALEIDDTELGSAITIMDSLLGRKQRMSIVTIVRSAGTGHKAINRGPVNVADYLLIYAKHRARFRPNAMAIARDGIDPAYSTYLVNPSAALSKWQFRPLKTEVATRLGYDSTRAAKKVLGESAFSAEVKRFTLAHGTHIVRFAQPRYEAVGKDVRAIVDRSKKKPDHVMRLERGAHKDVFVLGGNRILFLNDKIQKIDGEMRITEPLTNVWSDIGFQGIAKEGGVRFVRNKKPEKLLARIVSLLTDDGDWVLDPFAGSGTTAAVAEKMNRRWLAIEREKETWNMARARLANVMKGSDTTGISSRTRR